MQCVTYLWCLWPIPCKRKLEVNSQFSQHELNPVFIGTCTSQVSENHEYCASVLGFHFLWDIESRILYKRDKLGHM